MLQTKDTTYNKTIQRVKEFLYNNPRSSLYQISGKIKSDPRTIKSVLDIMEDLYFVEKEELNVGNKTYTNYKIRGNEKMKTKQQKTLFKEMLDKVTKEEGYRFGQLWRHTNKSLGGVMPIIMDNVKEDDRGYVMLEEVKDKIKITDTGNIGMAKATSQVKQPVFIRLGTMLKGETQERAVDTSVVIMPKEETEIGVKCIHASKGIRSGAQILFAGSAPQSIERSFASRAGQGQVWNKVQSYNMKSMRLGKICGMAATGATDDLVETMKEVKKRSGDAKKILKNIPSVEGQVGCVIFDSKGVLSLEVFDHPQSWKAFHGAIYEKYEDILTDEQEEQLFDFKVDVVPKLVKGFINDMMNAEAKVVIEGESTKTYTLTGAVIGEVTEIGGNTIHILGLRKEKGDGEREEPGFSGGFSSYRSTLMSV